MTSPPPPNPNQPFAQGQQGNVQGSDGSTPSDSGTSSGNIIDDVGSAVGSAIGSVVGINAIINAIGTIFNWIVERISAGLAHFANVWLNNQFYAMISLAGGILVVGGFIMLINATPAGDAVRGAGGSALGIAAKVLPI